MMKFESFKIIFYTIAIGSISIGIGSCSSSTDPYQSFVGNGEVEYSQRPDTVLALSGQGRVVLKLLRPSNPRVKKVGIFWNSGHDSLKVEFPEAKDTLQVNINGLDREGAYSFDIYTYDKNGEHKSVATTKSVKVYGNVYAGSITSRSLAYLDIKAEDTIVHLDDNPEGSIGTVLKFTNKSGKPDSAIVPPDSLQIHIPLSEVASSLSYYSLYQPGASIDIFQTTVSTSAVESLSSFTIYDDKLHKGWSPSSFGGTKINIKNMEHVFKGKYAAKVNYFENNHGALIFGASEPLDLSNYSTIQATVYAGSNVGSKIRIRLRDSNGKHIYKVNTDKDEWKTYIIPLSEIGSLVDLKRFVLQSDGDVGADVNAWVDEVKLY